MTPKVKEILGWYESDNPGSKTSLARILNHGHLAGTGKLVDPAGGPGFRARPGPQLRRRIRRPTIRATIFSSPSTPA